MQGHIGWQKNITIKNAINVSNGVVLKDEILDFQYRQKKYPHLFL